MAFDGCDCSDKNCTLRHEPKTEPQFPVGKCKRCRKDVGPTADGRTIVFCSYECYCLD